MKTLLGCLMLCLLFSGCKKEERENPLPDNHLVTLSPVRSLSILSISANKGLSGGVYSPEPLADLLYNQDVDVTAIQDVDFRTATVEGKDMVTELAYLLSAAGKPRQGLFTPVVAESEGETGLGLLVRGCFNGTQRLFLDDVLMLHTMNYPLVSGEMVKVATCQFDRADPEIMESQANALNGYADTITYPVVIAASIHEEAGSDILRIIETRFRRSCGFSPVNTYPASDPEFRYDYILTPLSQSWGTQTIQIVGDETISDHLGVMIRVGLMDK